MSKKPSASIAKIVFSGGSEFSLDPKEKVMLVGPNNSGKSQSLREILSLSQNEKKERPLVVSEVQISKAGNAEDLREFLENKGSFVNGAYRYEDWTIPEHQINFWSQPYLIHSLLHGFIKKIAADDRLTICAQQNSIAPGDQKSKPQHVLYDDEALMAKLVHSLTVRLARTSCLISAEEAAFQFMWESFQEPTLALIVLAILMFGRPRKPPS